jgi:hypothetical protein
VSLKQVPIHVDDSGAGPHINVASARIETPDSPKDVRIETPRIDARKFRLFIVFSFPLPRIEETH